MRCAGRCGSVTRTRCPSCSPCRWTGGSSRTCLGSRARWAGDQDAGAAVAMGGGAGPRGGGADRRGRVADRDEHDRDAGRRAACESAAADPGGASPGPAARDADRPRSGAAPRAPQPGRRARDRSRDVPLLVERATRLTAARHYRAAQRDLERALRSDPAHADALAALGVVLSRKGLWSEAVPLLRRVVDSEPGRAIAWYRLGEALNKVDDLLGARAAYRRAVEVQP